MVKSGFLNATSVGFRPTEGMPKGGSPEEGCLLVRNSFDSSVPQAANAFETGVEIMISTVSKGSRRDQKY